MSKIGRNDPCPSGAGVKFKKCLQRHPALNSDATAADLWWVCDRWVAAAPAGPDLLVSLAHTQSAPLDKLDDLLNRALATPSEAITMDWANVFAIFARLGYPDMPRLYQRISSKLPDASASFYVSVAKCAADRAGSLLPEIVKDFLKLGDAAVDQAAFDSVHQSAQRAGRAEQTAQLEERFPHLVAPKQELKSSHVGEDETSNADDDKGEAADAEDKNSWPDNLEGEAPLPPELQARVDELWERFNAIKEPSREQMDEHLTHLLTLPPEATDWAELLRELARMNHPDLPAVIRLIAAAVPHIKAHGMAWFYWAAAEALISQGRTEILPEIAAGYQKLDLASYDPDALSHLLDYLLAYGYEAEALTLAEYFLPIQREDLNLLEWVVPCICQLIFELRLGEHLRTPPTGMTVDGVAEELCKGIEEDIVKEAIRLGAEIASGRAPEPNWSRSSFELVIRPNRGNSGAQKARLRLLASVIWVAKEAWQVEHAPAGCALHGVHLIESSAYDPAPKTKKTVTNLLDCLSPDGMEAFVATACRGLFNVNGAKVRLMLSATGLLARFARRHNLVRPDQAAATEKELARLAAIVESPGT